MAGRDLDARGRLPRMGPNWWVAFLSSPPLGPPAICLSISRSMHSDMPGAAFAQPDTDGRLTIPQKLLRASGLGAAVHFEMECSPVEFRGLDDVGWAIEDARFRGANEVFLTIYDHDVQSLMPESAMQRVSTEVLRTLAENPAALHMLTPRQFEALIAGLLEEEGFTVVLTPSSNDHGVDVYAVEHGVFGPSLVVVDCKRYHAGRPVGVGLVRQINGVLWEQQADIGMLVTTSRFTRGARGLAERYPTRIQLRDFEDVHQMVRESLRLRRSASTRPHQRR